MRKTVWLSYICVLASLLPNVVRADRSLAGQQLQLAIATNAAKVKHLTARVQLESWQHQQLAGMKSRGHASWDEVARQQSLTEQLHAGLQSEQDYGGYLEAMNRRFVSIQPSVARERVTRTTAIKLAMPGSVRLTAWLPVDQLPVEYQASLLHEFDAPTDDELRNAEQRFGQLQRRVNHLHQNPIVPANRTVAERLSFEHAVARTQLELLRQQARVSAFERQRLDAVMSRKHPQPAANRPTLKRFIDHQRSRALANVTHRVAAAEAESTSRIRLAKIRLMRAERTADSLQRANMPPQQLADAQAAVTVASDELQTATSEHEKLKHSYRLLANSDLDSIDALPDDFGAAEVPVQLLADSEALGHLLLLRQRRLREMARSKAAQVEVDRLSEKLQRLDAIASHSVRLQNEREDIRLKMQEFEAEANVANDQTVALGLEEQRFALQMQQQYVEAELVTSSMGRISDDDFLTASVSSQATFLATAFLGLPPAGWQHYAATSLGYADLTIFYVETLRNTLGAQSLSLSPQAAGDFFARGPSQAWLSDYHRSLQRSGVRATKRPFAVRPPRTDFARYNPFQVGVPFHLGQLMFSPMDPAGSGVDFLYRRARMGRFDANRLRSRLDSYHHDYAFGIRRHDSRNPSQFGRANPYGGPWYRPGSSANFR